MGNDIIYLGLDFKLNENTGAGVQCSENSKMKGLQNLDRYHLTVQLTGCPCKSKVSDVMHISCSISSNIRTSHIAFMVVQGFEGGRMQRVITGYKRGKNVKRWMGELASEETEKS